MQTTVPDFIMFLAAGLRFFITLPNPIKVINIKQPTAPAAKDPCRTPAFFR